jgi:1-acyl-sn-glycerol-3-phosphate acyltransferase
VADPVTVIDHRGAPRQRSTWRTYLVLGHTLVHSAKVVGSAAAGRLTLKKTQAIMASWCERIFEVAKITLVARGVERLSEGAPYVLLSNHVSLLDPPSVIATFPGLVRFLSKEELRRVPVFGAALEKGGIVFIDRKNLGRAIEQLEGVKQALLGGTSFWIAAEGRRSRDGRLHPFKKGGFHVAQQLGAPIVPVWIEGTLDVLPPDQWASVTGQQVSVSYGEPIATEGLGADDLPALMRRTREAMLRLAREAGAREDVDAEG